jgi:nitrite reductase/ring-hydroxylating ferredoxin subunit
MTEARTGPVFLCRLDDIEDPGSKGFEQIDGEKPFFVVRRGTDVFAYRNSCPHYGAPLDWKPDAFLSYEKDRILCSMHSALFNIDDGVCTDGPCPGQALEKRDVEIVEGGIYLATD